MKARSKKGSDFTGGGGGKGVAFTNAGFENPGPTKNLRGIEKNTARQHGGPQPPITGITAKDNR